MYVRGGYNVYPMEVEAILASHPAVRDIAVVPRADPVMGEVGVAVVVPRDPASIPSLDDLRRFGGERLAPFKLPEAIRVVDGLPLTAMNKVDRGVLAAHEADAAAATGEVR
jgi:acyl-CoA synthetase (AMP-forming)/AMP-acid ligase II